ncbi:hypothetical protein [Nocardioides pelophilus]|uniref:hypothetical protein n=1 Tax=Nocardioides pelophilus TaxID=2172019 RepID=UPI001602A43C|nr:hypothetical protein [Nocardioides pelophilus]
MSIEELVRAELRDVAGSVDVPRMPSLDAEPDSVRHRWPVLVAAAVVGLILVGGAQLVLRDRDTAPEPSRPPEPTPGVTRTPSGGTVPRTAPSGAVVFGGAGTLSVDGKPVPGSWQVVAQQGPVWAAYLTDWGELWWGRGADRHRIDGPTSGLAISPDARSLAWGATDAQGNDTIHLVDTASGQERARLPVEDRGAAGGPVMLTSGGTVVFQHCVAPATDSGGWPTCSKARLEVWLPEMGVTDRLPLPASKPDVLSRMVVPSGTDNGIIAKSRREARPAYLRITRDGAAEVVAALPWRAVAVSADERFVLVEGECAGPLCPWEVEPFGGGERREVRPPSGWSFMPSTADRRLFSAPLFTQYGEPLFVLSHSVEEGSLVTIDVASVRSQEVRPARCDLSDPRCVLVEPN